MRFTISQYHPLVLTLTLVILSVVFLSPLFVANDLHDPTRMGKIFFFTDWMLLVIPVGLAALFLKWKQAPDTLSLFVLAWLGWILLRGKTGGIWHDEKFFWFSGCFAFFFIAEALFSLLVKKDRFRLVYIPLVAITIVAATEAVMGLLQIYGEYTIYHHQFKVTGTFFNPAPYAGFLVASAPWALFLSAVKNTKLFHAENTEKTQRTQSINIIHWLGYLAACLMFVVIPSTQSRAGYLGLITAILIWVSYRYKPFLYLKTILNTRLKRRLAITVVPLISVILLTGLYLFKKDSASGRLLIWKVAMNTIKEQSFTGHGFNTIQATLAPAQAAYFAGGHGSESEKMLAGSVRWAFNEPFQAASETGIIGLALMLLVVGYALFYKIPKAISREKYLMIGAARAALAGIMVFGCFSYPFYSLPVTLLFFFALAVLAALKGKPTRALNPIVALGYKVPLIAGIFLLGLFYSRQTPKLKRAYWLWDEAESIYRMSDYPTANKSFAETYPVLKHNGLFLQQYGKCLAMDEKYPEAVEKLTVGGNLYRDEYWYITLGDCYKALGDYTKAEESYMQAANMVPHKFYPEYLLTKMYEESGQLMKAVAKAKMLLGKIAKVHSTAIEEIKEEMQRILDKYSMNQREKEQEANNSRKPDASCSGLLNKLRKEVM